MRACQSTKRWTAAAGQPPPAAAAAAALHPRLASGATHLQSTHIAQRLSGDVGRAAGAPLPTCKAGLCGGWLAPLGALKLHRPPGEHGKEQNVNPRLPAWCMKIRPHRGRPQRM